MAGASKPLGNCPLQATGGFLNIRKTADDENDDDDEDDSEVT